MKPSDAKVNLDAMIPAMWPDLIRLDNLLRVITGYELIVTSANDGEHTARTSDHYRGGAIDQRTWTTADSGVQVKGGDRDALYRKVKDFMGVNWYVRNEHNHFHLSYRPIYRG